MSLIQQLSVLIMAVGLTTGATPLIRRMEGRRPALDATEAIQRVLDVLDEDFLDIGSPIKGTVVMSTELARFIDPTLLTLESMLFDSYCRTPTINAFSKKCRGLDQPVTFSACNDHGSSSASGTVVFESSTPSKQCVFFVQSQGNKINLKCQPMDVESKLDNIMVYSAANSAVNTNLNAGAPTVQYDNGLFIRFKNGANGSQKLSCTWSAKSVRF